MVTMVTEGLYSTPLLSYLGVLCGNYGNRGAVQHTFTIVSRGLFVVTMVTEGLYSTPLLSYLGVLCGNNGNRGAVQHTFTVVSRGTLW